MKRKPPNGWKLMKIGLNLLMTWMQVEGRRWNRLRQFERPASSRRLFSLLFCWMKFCTVSLSTFNTCRMSFRHVRFLQLELSCLAFCFCLFPFLILPLFFAFLIFFCIFDFLPFFVLNFFLPLLDSTFLSLIVCFSFFSFLLLFCFIVFTAWICSNLPALTSSLSSFSSLGNPEKHELEGAVIIKNTTLTFHHYD